MTILKKLLIFVLSLSLIPMLIIGTFSFFSAKKSLEYEILKKLESIADLKVQKIEAFLKERVGDAFVISNSVFLQDDFILITRYLNENNMLLFQQIRAKLSHQLGLYNEAYGYRDIMLVNPQGIIVYTSNSSHFNVEYGKHIPERFADTFEKSRKKISFSGVYRGPVNPLSFLMTMAAPVKNAGGVFIGEIFFEIEMKVIYDLLDDKTGLGSTGETLLAQKTAEGALFLNPLVHDSDAALTRVAKSGTDMPILNAVNGKTGSGIGVDYHADTVIAAWRPIPRMNWGMVAKIDISEAFDSVNSMRNNIVMLLLISISVVTVVVLRITRSITAPIVNLTKVTQQVKEGHLFSRADILTKDEIGELAKNFNAMVEKLTQTNASLKEAQRIANLGNWELDLSTHILSWSNEMYKIFELDININPSHEILLSSTHPEDKDFVKIIHTDSSILRSPYYIQYRLLIQGERIKYVDEQCETIFDSDDKPLRTMGIIHDITAQKEAEQEILLLNRDLENRVAQRTEQLETANKELEAFSYSVSHDLRAPLRSITGFAELLKNQNYKTLDEKSRHYLNVISESTVQMGGLIDDILSFSRMSRTEMMETIIDFSILTKNAIKSLDNEISGRKINWKINPMPNSKGDLSMIQLVMINLISNAIKFTKNREVAEIEIGSIGIHGDINAASGADIGQKEDEITYYIKDNGAGFDMNYANKLFKLFQRLHRLDEFSGTGVGLANVHRIITRHGGRIWAVGKPDEGATFYFTLYGSAEEALPKE